MRTGNGTDTSSPMQLDVDDDDKKELPEYVIPYWIFCSFFDGEGSKPSSAHEGRTPFRQSSCPLFVPDCRWTALSTHMHTTPWKKYLLIQQSALFVSAYALFINAGGCVSLFMGYLFNWAIWTHYCIACPVSKIMWPWLQDGSQQQISRGVTAETRIVPSLLHL